MGIYYCIEQTHERIHPPAQVIYLVYYNCKTHNTCSNIQLPCTLYTLLTGPKNAVAAFWRTGSVVRYLFGLIVT